MVISELNTGDTITEAKLNTHFINRVGTTTELDAVGDFAVGDLCRDTTLNVIKKVLSLGPTTYAVVEVFGLQDISIDASSGIASLPAGTAIRIIPTSNLPIISITFDPTTSETAYFKFTPPANWDSATTLKAKTIWTCNGGGASETVQWDVSIAAVSDDDSLTTLTFGTSQPIDDTRLATDDLHVSPFSAAITPGGSPAAGDTLWIRLVRDVSADTLSVDAELIELVLRLTIKSGVAATS